MLKELQNVLHQQIPITNHLGILVESYENNTLKLSSPLSKNHNHMGTAFGGSIYSICVLAGWSIVYLKLKENNITDGHIVIAESHIDYLKPVNSDLIAECTLTEPKHLTKLIRVYNKHGISKIKLITKIYVGNEVAVEFSGKYVVHK
jgi:thioesterase domain-containing protein